MADLEVITCFCHEVNLGALQGSEKYESRRIRRLVRHRSWQMDR